MITTNDLPLEDYAPAAVVMNDTLYFMASAGAPLKIYKTGDPKSGKWQIANSSFPIGMIDPDLFVDDDGRLFFYYGCSNVNPIYAVELDTKTLNPIGKPVELFNSNKKINGWERKGDYNELPENPWIEGSWMTKHNGKYYLQYAGPGTSLKVTAMACMFLINLLDLLHWQQIILHRTNRKDLSQVQDIAALSRISMETTGMYQQCLFHKSICSNEG